MDAVSDRDFVIDLHSSIATCMVHLSRISEEIIIWASKEFGLVSINDKYATGSSIMPQKKNPDVAELVRGKSARTIGNLVQILTLMKGLPLTYNRDLQEDKEPLFDSINTVINSLSITKGLLKALTFNKKTAENLAIGGYSLATDIADYLTIKGIPFRESHNIVGKIVQYCIKKNLSFSELSLDEYKQFSEKFNKDILDLDARQSLRNRNLLGGTSPQQVQKALKKAEVQLNKFIKKIKL
jgi:argininosuccinate lyase